MAQFDFRYLGPRRYEAPPVEAYRMEDAPKNGTWILIWGYASFGLLRPDHDLQPTWQRAYWESSEEILGTGCWCGTEDIAISEPIAWIPVPGPPQLPATAWTGSYIKDDELGALAWITY